MQQNHYEIIVIGSGPGGEGAAMMATKLGKKTALVEMHSAIGGACTHKGTIPSKALRHSVEQFREFKAHPVFGKSIQSLNVEYPEILKMAQGVIDKQARMRRSFYTRNHIEIYKGFAKFTSANSIEVRDYEKTVATLTANNIIIATGSSPYQPDDIDFSHPRICDSDSILSLEKNPLNITIYGAGVIGCEYACIFRNLDIKVNLINTRDKLLSFLDNEIIDALNYHLRDQGVLIRHNEVYEKVETKDDAVYIYMKSGKIIKTDVLLWAQGRSGNTNDMCLDKADVAINYRKQVEVNSCYQTQNPNIYAVGDVIGVPALASAAYDQGRFATKHALGETAEGEEERLLQQIPTGIYTTPEISSIGKTEQELTEEKIPYEIGHSFFRNLARAQIADRPTGMLKLLFHRETLEILGVHCFGNQASEIIHIGQSVMMQQNNIHYFVDTTFNYPTMAEAYRVAALNGLNRLF